MSSPPKIFDGCACPGGVGTHSFVEYASVGTHDVFLAEGLDETAGGAKPDLLAAVIMDGELSPRNIIVYPGCLSGLEIYSREEGERSRGRAQERKAYVGVTDAVNPIDSYVQIYGIAI